jgi:hypothetical protein
MVFFSGFFVQLLMIINGIFFKTSSQLVGSFGSLGECFFLKKNKTLYMNYILLGCW